MKKNILLVVFALLICLITAPQIFGLETASSVNVEAQPMEFETYLTTMPEREIPACDMAELEMIYDEFIETEQANEQAEANKQLDDLCFKLATYPYAD